MPAIDECATILERLFRHAENSSNRVACRFLHDSREAEVLTFERLGQRVSTLASRLQEEVAIGDRAILLYPPGLEFIEAFLGCLAAGIIAVPANTPRRNRNTDRLRAIFDDARPRVVLGTRQVLDAMRSDEAGVMSGMCCLATDTIETEPRVAWSCRRGGLETVAFLQYTSGSTGTPRGVVVTHGNIAANEWQIEASYRHTGDSVMVSWLPLFHDMGLIGGVLQPLYVGFPAILLSPITFLREPVSWLRAISQYRGTTSGAPNFAYDHCVRTVTDEQKEGLDLSSWSIAYNGAEPVRADTLDRFTGAFARCGFRAVSHFPCYGLAEATLFVSGGPAGGEPKRLYVDAAALEAGQVRKAERATVGAKCLVSCGVSPVGLDLMVVDPETRRVAPVGRIGEIWMGSKSVAAGYWNRADDTEAVFRNWLGDTAERPFLATGDLGFVDSGELYVTGRVKDLIIIRGRSIYAQDIESVVQQAVPFTHANGCAAFLDMDGGQLCIVMEGDREAVRAAHRGVEELNAVLATVRSTVAREFDVAVGAIVIVKPGSFPRTSSGKVRRKTCRDEFATGTLEHVASWRSNAPCTRSAS